MAGIDRRRQCAPTCCATSPYCRQLFAPEKSDSAGAVIEAAGLRRPVRRSRPADLTERQVEVLRLVSRGLSNAEIAERLVLSRRTVEHHVQDIYVKIGAATRAAAAMFAMQHGLL
jgi:DNA-binding NarL/FixJ family response regulator